MLKVGEFIKPNNTPQRWLVVLIRYTSVDKFYYVCFRNGVRRNFFPHAYSRY